MYIYIHMVPLQYSYWKDLALPADAEKWDNITILDYFVFELLTKAKKILAFAEGLHARLGAASHVSCLNELILVMIGMCCACACMYVCVCVCVRV